MILYLTKNLADKLKLTPAPAKTTEEELFSWRANYVQGHGCQFVVFINDACRFAIVINEAKAAKLKKLPELFLETLRETFLALGVSPEVIGRYISESGEITYAKNADRKKTAQLNKSTETVWWALRDHTGDLELSLRVSNILCNISGVEETIRPRDVMLELLGRYELPVLKYRALDLTVRLDLGGENKDPVRRLRVPISISFKQLHIILQKAFGWQNYHLYSFGVFREWSENPYDRPDIELVTAEEDFDFNPDAKLMAGLKLSDYVPEFKKILYNYDFGDDWHHYIEIENIIEDCKEKLPVLLSGEGDSPPEDVGGPGGFAEFLKIISDPEHEEHKHMTKWADAQWWKPFDFAKTARLVQNTL